MAVRLPAPPPVDYRQLHVSLLASLNQPCIEADYSLCIPLKPVEEEADPEKAQKLEEMITILRKVSSPYLVQRK